MIFPGYVLKCVVQLRNTLVLIAVLAPFAGAVYAQENSDCFNCHNDQALKSSLRKNTSLFVDEKTLSASVHAGVACVGCHADLQGKDLPHDVPLKPAQCGTCHDKEFRLYSECKHGKAVARGDPLAPRCKDCHGSHNILPVSDPQSAVAPIRIPFVCGTCHREGSPVQRQRVISQDHILENFTESIHGEGLLKKGLSVAATCASCHSPHLILPHTDPRSSIARIKIAKTCSKCHTQIETVHRKIIKGELWEKEAHILPACVDCHQPHKARRVFYDQGMADSDCMRCHQRKDITASSDGRSLFVNLDEMSVSKHAKKVACSQCHTQVTQSLQRPCSTIKQKVDCAACHTAVGEQYQQSTHGKLFAKQDVNAPTCKECHGTHTVRAKLDPLSPIFPTNIPDLCARCHQEGKKAAVRYAGKQHEIISRYTESIHGKGLLKSGLVVTATCTDCHTSHRELPGTDSTSSINASNIPTTCGRCHHGIEELFTQSIHSKTVSKTDKPLPVCSDCHTAHTIRRTDEVGFQLTIMSTCGKCHEQISKTYFDTYHGKVSQLGYTKTAKCFDCHGSHDILPPSNPASHLSRHNVVATCQKCHPGATRRFAGYLTHATHHDPEKYPVLFWVFWAMTGLVIGTFIFSGLHTLLWFPRAWQMRKRRHEEEANPNEKQFQRFTRLNRILHITMIVSFITLTLTGMTLKFSYTGWASIVSRVFGGFEVAGYIHRFAATIMVCLFIVHVVDLFRRKKKEYGSWYAMLTSADTMLPTKKDLQDLIGSLRWFIGKGDRPKYGRWTYWEKFDYFAVFWGIAIIGTTGLTLWFPEFFTQIVPGWFINVATIIHSDEALLATGFIFSVHFFNTHLRPEKFPMDIVVFTGRMPLEEFKRDKPLEYETLVRNGELEKYLVEPYPPIVIRAIRVFGWTALTIGFSVVLWILYAMIFTYK